MSNMNLSYESSLNLYGYSAPKMQFEISIAVS